ncbi:MAG: hypothetical protein AAGA35_00460 [Patescibacteria group bacterium]
METEIIKLLVPAILAFIVGIAITPAITHFLYKHEMWKKKAGKGTGYGGGGTPIFDQLHKEKDTNTPRMGGLVIWVALLITIVLLAGLDFLFPNSLVGQLDFLSRSQTWIPLFTLLVGAVVGFLDDYLEVKGLGKHFAGGLPLSQRMLVVLLTSSFIAWWFYEKLEVSSISFFMETIELGVWFIPFFLLVSVCIYMSSVIDGIDGLSGGVFVFIFGAYTFIAFSQSQFDLAAFCAALVGATLAFLWFNVPPARFYMTETGVMALTMTITVVAFMTDTLGDGEGLTVLPIIGFLLVATVAGNTIQILSKKLLGRKVFLVAPIHHHFEALGWPGHKVTMRYWIIGLICAVIGIVIAAAI